MICCIREEDRTAAPGVPPGHPGPQELVTENGELTEAAVQKLVQDFGGKANILTQEPEELRVKLQENLEGLEAAALRGRGF